MIVLERGEYVSVRKSHVGMWVTVSRHFAKGIGEVRMQRISQVKNESASRVMIIRKQHPSYRPCGFDSHRPLHFQPSLANASPTRFPAACYAVRSQTMGSTGRGFTRR